MPRVGRKAVGGVVYHVLNRGNGRSRLFHKPGDYDAFVRILAEAKAAVPVRVLGVCLMPNHGSTERSPKSGTCCCGRGRTATSRGSCWMN